MHAYTHREPKATARKRRQHLYLKSAHRQRQRVARFVLAAFDDAILKVCGYARVLRVCGSGRVRNTLSCSLSSAATHEPCTPCTFCVRVRARRRAALPPDADADADGCRSEGSSWIARPLVSTQVVGLGFTILVNGGQGESLGFSSGLMWIASMASCLLCCSLWVYRPHTACIHTP